MKLVGQTAGLSEEVKAITVEERQARLDESGFGGKDVTFGARQKWLDGELKKFGAAIEYHPHDGFVATMTKPNRVPLTIPLECFGDAVAWLICLERHK